MKIRIVKQPLAQLMDSVDLRWLQVGRVYELGTQLAEYLIVSGYAIAEMRVRERGDNERQFPDDKSR